MVSLIITTFNEGHNIGALLGDLVDQTQPPTELVLVDGGSTDNTVTVCEGSRSQLEAADINLNLIVAPGVNIACGRNIAIGAASYECICVTDAGCRLDPRWCERITRPILDSRVDFVGGFFRPVHHNRFQRILAALTVANQPPRGFLPSSRSIAFTRSLWQRAGTYPEWLAWGEDTLFNEHCLATGARYEVAKDAIVHWEVRPSYHAAVKQYYRYALGDGRRRRLSVSHLLNTGAVVLSIALGIVMTPWWLTLFPVYVLLIAAKTRSNICVADLPTAFCIVFAIRLARVAGYLQGLATSVGRSEVKAGV